MESGGGVILPSGGHWQWREFWLLQLGEECNRHLKPSDAAKRPTVPRAAPTPSNKSLPVPKCQ